MNQQQRQQPQQQQQKLPTNCEFGHSIRIRTHSIVVYRYSIQNARAQNTLL